MDIFSSEKLSDHVTRIIEITGTYMYLVEGTDRALLVDTGCGIGNLKEYVNAITQKPLTIVCTHGHMDHSGGTQVFDEVFLNKADWELSPVHGSLENRKSYIRMTVNALHPEITQQEIEDLELCQTRKDGYRELTDQMIFDLGGIHVKALAMPGHTPGSMCMLFEEERMILFGDACTPSEFLFDTEAGFVEDYKKMLLEFKKYEPFYDKVLLSHGPCIDWPKELLAQTVDVCDEIMASADDKAEFHFFMGGVYRAAHEMLPNNMRKDGGLANIIYNPKKIFRHKTH